MCLADPSLCLRDVDALRVGPRSGSVDLEHEDLVLGDGPGRFVLRRTYAPRGGGIHDFGTHWATCFDVRVVIREHAGFVRTPRGAFVSLKQVDETTWASTRGALWVDVTDPQRPTLYGLDGRAYVCGDRGLLSAIRSDGVEVRVERDALGLVSQVQGPWGALRVERTNSVLQALVLPSGRRVRYTRAPGGALASVDDGRRRATYTYDEAGRLSGIADGAAQLTYDALGRVREVSGPRVERRALEFAEVDGAFEVRETLGGRELVHRFDFAGAWAETHEAGRVTRLSYDARGNLARLERGGLSVALERDARGRVVQKQTADALTRVTYADGSERVAELSRGGETVRYVHDAAGRLRATRDAQGVARFDADGRPVGAALAGGLVARSSVGPRGTRHEVRDAQGRVLRASERDLRGRLVKLEDVHGQVQTFAYDPQGRLIETDTPNAAPVRLSYDAQGRLIEVADAAGSLVGYTYGEDGALSVRDAAAGERRVTLDALGRTVEVAQGEETLTQVFNERGQLVARATPAGRERFRYGVDGELSEAQGPAGRERRTYDARGLLASVEDGQGQALTARYDAQGRRVALETPWGVVGYRRDDAGNLTGVRLPDGQAIELELGPEGRRQVVRFPNGVRVDYAWEGALLTGVRAARGEEVLLDRALRYDGQGRLVELTDEAGATRYAYDAEGRLISVERGSEGERYTYDARGNRTDLGACDAGNRLQADGLAYDAWGRLVEADGHALRYDLDGRLIAATLADGRELSWTLDHAGRRVARTLAGETTRYLHDGQNLAAVYGAQGLETAFVHGDGLDDTLAVLHDGAWHFPLVDQLQSVVGLTDGEGALLGRARYAAFGAVEASTLPAWCGLGFTGRPQDPELGWVDLRARFYAPSLARFTSPDPIGLRGGVNVYAYAGNAPLSFSDPLGTSEIDPSQLDPESEAEIRAAYSQLLGQVPPWVAAEVEASDLDPLLAVATLAPYAQDQGWIDDDYEGALMNVAIEVAQDRLGTSIPTPIDAQNPSDVALNLLLAATFSSNPYSAAAGLTAGLAMDYYLDHYTATELQPGMVVRHADGTYTSSLLPGYVATSYDELSDTIRANYDADGDGRWDDPDVTQKLPDFAKEGKWQEQFRISTVLPDGSFTSDYFPGVVFGPDQGDEFIALVKREYGADYINPFLYGNEIDGYLEYLRLNTTVNLAAAQQLGLDPEIARLRLANGTELVRYTTSSFPTEAYRSLELMVADATRAAQEEIAWAEGQVVLAGPP
ncbi:MAG: RHS repeat-associated core domain-containing protein, partial [Planctomycetota bacterium]